VESSPKKKNPERGKGGGRLDSTKKKSGRNFLSKRMKGKNKKKGWKGKSSKGKKDATGGRPGDIKIVLKKETGKVVKKKSEKK